MRVVATTVVRESIRGKQRTGYIYDVDWEAQRVERRLPVPDPSFPASNENPRGGVRGGRGVAATREGIVVANYDTLYRYDDDWNMVDSLSHPLFVGIHEIDWDGAHIWAAATGIDAVLRTALDGGAEAVWDPHDPRWCDGFGLVRRPHPLDGSVDYRIREAPLLNQCHINGVARVNGTTVVNCGLVRDRKSKLARTFARGKRRLLGDRRAASGRRHSGRSMVLSVDGGSPARVLVGLGDHDFPTHNGQVLQDGRVVVNDSTANVFRMFELDDGTARETLAVPVPGTWLRGLEPVDPGHVLVGSAPAALLLVDTESGSIEGRVQLSEDPNEAVHGLALCPPPLERL